MNKLEGMATAYLKVRPFKILSPSSFQQPVSRARFKPPAVRALPPLRDGGIDLLRIDFQLFQSFLRAADIELAFASQARQGSCGN